MGTRSTIALEYADGSVGQVYCHWDGYLSNNGKILLNYYEDPFKVRALLDEGDMSSLDTTVEGCSFYKERGEDCPQNMYKNSDEYFDCSQQEEYDYILRQVEGRAVWFVRHYSTDGVWVELAEAIADELIREAMQEEALL
jgi:hypothetical protein